MSKDINLYYYGRIFINKDLLISNSFNSQTFFSSIERFFPIKTDSIENSLWYVDKNKIIECKECILKHYCLINNLPIKKVKTEMFVLSRSCQYRITNI